jgi:hypothetical protein
VSRLKKSCSHANDGTTVVSASRAAFRRALVRSA